MAQDIKSKIVLSINSKEIDGSFQGLQKSVKKLSDELNKLKPGTEKFQQKAAELKEVREHFEKVKKEIDAVNGKIKAAENSITSYRSEIKRLSTELNRMDVGSTQFKETKKQIDDLKNKLREAQGLTGSFTEKGNGLLGNVRRKLADFGIGITEIGIGLGVAKLSQATEELIKVSDAMSDVQKTTGMTLGEVKELWDAFDEMDTRTSKLDRLKIAEEAGRLGVPKQQMREFVQEIDKVNVALGDSFKGGLEEIVGSLGKIKGLFEETKGKTYALAINEVGSAMNELAASGTASEGNIADFTLRVGALPDALKPSIDKVLGLGAAFEESGLDSQIAASGYTNFMKVAGENLEAFAYSMNMSIEEARELFNTRPEEFFLRFSEGMRGLSADETAKVFDSLKLNSLEVQKAVGAAANRTDEFRATMELAGDSMKEATSLTDEFNKKNESAAAVWQKIKNVFADTFTSTNAINWFESVIFLMGNLLGVTGNATGGVNTLKQSLQVLGDITKVVIAAFLGYQAVVIQNALWTKNYTYAKWLQIVADKADILITSTKTAVKGAYNAVLVALKIRTDQATASTAALNAVSKLSPWGALIGLVTAMVTAYGLLANKIDEVSEEEKIKNKIQEEAIQSSVKEISALDKLYKAATDASKGKDAQREAVEKLQRLYPSYFGNMDAELIMLGKAEQKYKDLKEAILASARAKAAENIIKENTENSLKKELELAAENQKKFKEIKDLMKDPNKKTKVSGSGDDTTGMALDSYETNREKAYTFAREHVENQRKIAKIKKDNDKKNKEILDYIGVNKNIAQPYENDKANQLGSNIPKNITAGSGGSGKTNRPAKDIKAEQEQKNAQDLTKAKEAHQKALEQTAAEGKKMMELERSLADEKLKLQEESEEKAKEIEKNRYQREWVDLQLRNKDILNEIEKNNIEIEKLQNERNKTKSPQAQAEYDTAIAEIEKTNTAKQNLINKNNEIGEAMKETHKKNLLDIELKYILKDAENEQKAHDDEMRKLLTQNQEKLNTLNSLEKAKKEIYKQKADAEQNGEEYRLSEKEIEGIKTIEEAKKVLREDYERQALALQMEHLTTQYNNLEEMYNKVKLQPGFDPEALAKMGEDMEMLKQKMAAVKGEITGKKEGDDAKKAEDAENAKKEVDVLGFSVKDWEETFKNLETTEDKLKAVAMASKALSNAFSQFGKLQQAIGERDMRRFTRNQEKKKQALLRQLNQGLITQEQYHKAVQNIEDETAEKKRKIQKRAAMWEKAANIAGAISGTALAVVKALATPPPFNIKLAAIVGALGAVQIATIAATPLPEFAEGGFTGKGSGRPDRTGHRPAGIVHESEYVTPKWMLENPVVADVVDWMESIRTGRTALPQAYAEGGFAEGKSQTAEVKSINENLPLSADNGQLVSVLGEVRDLLSDLKENGVDAFMIEDAENGKRLKRTIKMFEKLEQKNARK